jgi:hypothetical protein
MIAVAPSLVRTLDAGDLDRVLIHEWAHVQRRDDLASALQIAVRVVAGWHPALWWIDRRLHVEREIACDEMVVAMTGAPKSYAECLVKLSGTAGASRALQMAPGVFGRSGLRTRIVRIVSPQRPIATAVARALAAAMVVMLCVLSAAVAGMTLVDAVTAAPQASPATRATAPAPDAKPLVAVAPPAAIQKKPVPRRAEPRRSSSASAEPIEAAPAPPPLLEPLVDAQPLRIDTLPASAHANVTPPADAVAPPALVSPPAPQPAAIAAETRTPWGAAAAGGTAIGKKSKDAAVKTAGFFGRVARRVAGSF